MRKSSPMANLVNIFVAPGQAFDEIRDHTAWFWWPLLLYVVASLGIQVWYMSTVDVHWLLLQTLEHNSAVSGKLDAEQIQKFADHATRSSMLIQQTLATAISTPLIYAVLALYYFLVAKVAGYEMKGYGQWFNFTAWSNLPAIFGPLVMALVYLLRGSHQVLRSDLNVTSLNVLFFHLTTSDPWYMLLKSLRLTMLWIIVLSIFGMSRWTRRSLGNSTVVVLLPYVLIYGIWILVKVA